MIYLYIMDYKIKIEEKGFRLRWVAKQIKVNYNSLRTYLNEPSKMPSHIEDKLKTFLR